MTRYIILNGNETVGFAQNPQEGLTSIPVPDDYVARARGAVVVGDVVTVIPGDIISAQEISRLNSLHTDKINRTSKITTDVNAFVGRNVSSLSSTEKIALLTLVLYKLGVLDASGVVQAYSNWVGLE